MENKTTLPIIRVMIAALFVVSGLGKVLAPAATLQFIASSGLPFAQLALVIAIGVELVGGLLLAFGVRTRLVAGGLAAFSIVTGLAFHHQIGDSMQLTQLLKNIAIAGGLLHIAAWTGAAGAAGAAAVRGASGQRP